jgi:hypothetical protein
MKSRLIAALAILLIVTLGFSSLAHSGQLTQNSYEDSSPQIKGDCLVWQGYVHGDWEILFYNIATQEFFRVTDNDYGDISPQTDGKYVVWLGFSHSGGEIFLYDISSGETTQITDDNNVDSPPQIANGRVVWGSSEVTTSVEPGEIFLYDIETRQAEQLTYNTLDDSSPRINDKSVMWLQDDGQATKVVVYDLDTGNTTVDPQGFIWQDSPQTDGDLRVLTRHDGPDREIFVYDSMLRTYEQITDNDFEDRSPCISENNNIAWVRGKGQFSEIFLNADIDPIDTDPPANLVTNPGFEDGNGWPSGWWTWSEESRTYFSSDNETFHSGTGSKSLKVTVKILKKYDVLVAQTVPVTPGECYNIGAWIKTENVTGPGAQVFIEWNYPDGKPYWGEYSSQLVTGSHDWQFTGVEGIRIPEDAATSATLYLVMREGSTGTAWFDDVIVEKCVKPLMRTFILSPNYRGKILPGAPSPEIKVEVTLNPEENGLALTELGITATLRYKNEDIVVQETLNGLSSNSFNVYLDIPAGTQPGEYDLNIGLHKTGDLLAQDTYPIKKLSPADLSVLTSYIDEHNRFMLKTEPAEPAEPFFPLGLYVAQDDTSQLQEIADSPFDTLMNYSINNVTDIETYLDELEERDLKLIFSLKDYVGHGQEDIDTITEKVDTFKTYPAIMSWYMNDELGLEYLPELEDRYQKVRELDENHPVWSVNWRKYVLIEEAHTTDILGVDPYPVPNNRITMVSDWADWAKEAGRGHRPLWLVPQIFGWSDYDVEGGRPPTPEEMRAMTYLAINHGAKGLIHYSYFDIRNDVDPPYDFDTRWPQIKEIASEIRDLRHVFLSTHQTNDNDIICNNGNIDFKLMREGDLTTKGGNTYYLFAVNTKEETITDVSFRINLALKPEVLFEDDKQQTPVVDENGDFTDDFGPYEVHVYYWQGDVDEDEDGFDSREEWGPDGIDSDYDGNGDGDADRKQGNVASGHTYDYQHYVTLSVSVPDWATLSDCRVLDNPSPADAADGVDFQYGFFEFTVNNIAATVKLYLPDGAEPITYFKYGPTPDDPTDHWYEFMYDGETGAEIDGNVITLHFVDGQRGDDDLATNGKVVDQGGPGFTSTGGTGGTGGGGGGSSGGSSGGGGGGSSGGGGCFIATAAFGSPMEKHVTTLRSFKDTYLLPCALGRILVRTYSRYSPPLAHFIAKHEILKAAARISLLPLVAISYATLHFGPVITLCMLVVLLILPILLVLSCRRKAAAVR